MAVHFKKFVIKNNFLTDAPFGSVKLSEIVINRNFFDFNNSWQRRKIFGNYANPRPSQLDVVFVLFNKWNVIRSVARRVLFGHADRCASLQLNCLPLRPGYTDSPIHMVRGIQYCQYQYWICFTFMVHYVLLCFILYRLPTKQPLIN